MLAEQADQTKIKSSGDVAAGLLMLLAVLVSPWAIATAYVSNAGIVVEGKVTGRREAITMPGGDSWQHVYEITYQYQPLDSTYPTTGTHRVAPALYHRLRIGSAVSVRYSPWRPLRYVLGVGSCLTDSSPFSRLAIASLSSHLPINLAIIAAGVLLAFAAYRRKSTVLGIAAAAILTSWLTPVIILTFSGLILFPTLFWGWCRNPGKGRGWALLASIAISAAVLYVRVPQPTPMPPGPQRHATAVVRNVRVVEEIWSGYQDAHGPSEPGGQDIREPFQMVDLEFTPVGAADSIHVMDRVDLGSVPELREGGTVPIDYSSSDPNVARIAGGTRNYGRQAMVYLLEVTYGIGAAVAFVVIPIIYLMGRLIRSLPGMGLLSAHMRNAQEMSGLPADDPRRKDWEQKMSAFEKAVADKRYRDLAPILRPPSAATITHVHRSAATPTCDHNLRGGQA